MYLMFILTFVVLYDEIQQLATFVLAVYFMTATTVYRHFGVKFHAKHGQAL